MGDNPKPADSDSPRAASRLAPGSHFGRYRIEREVGTGGMGSVYEAVLVDLNKRVALKVLAAELAHQEEYRQRFVREARAAARIRHPNVVEIFDVGVHDDVPFLAMEMLDGHDMRARFDRGVLAPTELLDLMIPVIAAVVTAHDVKVIHRDIKPENIFLNRQSGQGLQPVVLDFGISKVLDEDAAANLTATASMMGTPLYMSPEQVRGSRDVDPRTDQYAIAVMLYEGLTGQSAFDGNSVFDLLIKKTEGRFKPLRDHRAELPQPLCAAIERGMAADREARFASLRAFAQPLLPYASEQIRALWAAALSPSTPPEPDAARAKDGDRADSTLRSSVKEIEAISRPASRQRKWQVAALLAFALVGTAAARYGISLGSKPQPEPGGSIVKPAALATVPAPSIAKVLPSDFTVRVTATPLQARFTLDGVAAGQGTLERTLPKDGKPHTLEVVADGFEMKRVTFTDEAPPKELSLTPIPAKEESKPATTLAPAPAQPRTRVKTAKPEAAAAPAQPQQPSEERKPLTGSNDSPVLY